MGHELADKNEDHRIGRFGESQTSFSSEDYSLVWEARSRILEALFPERAF